MSAEDDLHSPAKDYQSAQIDIGTVGWKDREEWFDPGSADNDGFTFVYVTLYRGRAPGTPVQTGVAQGHQIRCHLSSLAGARIPPKGTRVLVAIPFGMDQLAGAGVIIATIEGTAQKEQLDEDRVVIDYGSETHVVIKAKSVTLQDSGSPANFVGVGTPKAGGARGIYVTTHAGAGFTAQGKTVGAFGVDNDANIKSLLQLTETEATLALAGVGSVKFAAGECMLFAAEPMPIKAPMVLLGPAAVVGTAAVYLLVGAPAPSTSVFISP